MGATISSRSTDLRPSSNDEIGRKVSQDEMATPKSSSDSLISLNGEFDFQPSSSISEDLIFASTDAIPGINTRSSSSTKYSSAHIQALVEKTYQFGSLLGKGASAEVFEVCNRQTGLKYACKIIHRNNHMNDRQTMTGEANALLALKYHPHANIAGLHELYVNRDVVWIVMDIANGGDLLTLLADRLPNLKAQADESYCERDVATIFRQLLQIIDHVHSLDIVHRDIKFDNLLFSNITAGDDEHDNGCLGTKMLLVDFGLCAPPGHRSKSSLSSKLFINNSSTKKSLIMKKKSKRLNEKWGTEEYFAPEMRSSKGYGSQADAWALGCILYEMLTGELAFPNPEPQPMSSVERLLVQQSLKNSPRPFEQRASWKELSLPAQDLVRKLLHRNPTKRLSPAEALQHPFIINHVRVHQPIHALPTAEKQLRGRWERREQRRSALAEMLQRQAKAKQYLHSISQQTTLKPSLSA
jgi:serine/threonine protein kinase